MYRLFSALAMVMALAFTAIPTQANAPTPASPAGSPLGIVPVHGQAHSAAGTTGNLSYHSGGPVQIGTHHTYAIYWGTSFSPTYQSIINGYFQNVAADSSRTSNVYNSDTQYYQSIGGTTYVTYSETFGGSWPDTSNPTSSGCTNTAGGTVACVSDAQIQQEVTKAIQTKGWPTGAGNEYFVFLGDGISTCSGSSCFVTNFCAYHSHYSLNGATVLYSDMPYTGHNTTACGSGQAPNGDIAADSTINVTSHEANETITDMLGNAWYDRRGNENGDKCAWNFGTATGNYNQTIGSAHYYLQGEWSNKSSGCVWSGT